MNKLVEQKLEVFKKRKVENILAQIFVLFQCFIFSWEQTLRFRFENFEDLSIRYYIELVSVLIPAIPKSGFLKLKIINIK
jgi:hypothetical protein